MIELKSKHYIVTEILRKTQAVFYKDFKVGDIFYFQYVLRSPGRGRSLYATNMTMCREGSDEFKVDSVTNFSKFIDGYRKVFEYVEVGV